MTTDLWFPGSTIRISSDEGASRFIVRKVSESNVFATSLDNGNAIEFGKAELSRLVENGSITFLSDRKDFGELCFDDLSLKEQAVTSRKYRYVSHIVSMGVSSFTEKQLSPIAQTVSETLEEKPPHWQSLRNWFKEYEGAGFKYKGLFPKNRYKGNRTSRLDPTVADIIDKVRQNYLKQSQPSIATMVRYVHDKIDSHNLEYPQSYLDKPVYNSIKKRIRGIDFAQEVIARLGKNKARHLLEETAEGIQTNRVLEWVEIDHTQVDLYVLDNNGEVVLGRPYITVLVDHFSQMVVGFQLSFEVPSFASVSMALKNAILTKEDYLEQFGLAGTWPCFGLMETIVADNGKEFWSGNFESCCEELGCSLVYCPIRKPEYKSRVERFFGIMNTTFLDDLPGVVRKKDKAGEDYQAIKEAKLTFNEFKRRFVKWLTEVHHKTPVGESETPPLSRWQQSIHELPIPEEDEVDICPKLMGSKTKKLKRTGINIFSQTYDSPLLRALLRSGGPSMVKVKYDPFDIGYIFVKDECNQTYLKVPCLNFAYACGLSEYENTIIRRRVSKKQKGFLEDEELIKSRIELMSEREEVIERNKRRKNKTSTAKIARAKQVGVDKPCLVIDNTEQSTVEFTNMDEDLNMDGWSVE